MKFEIFCNCGDDIEAETEEEAIKIFCRKHNFPLPNKFPKNDESYAEEFEVKPI